MTKRFDRVDVAERLRIYDSDDARNYTIGTSVLGLDVDVTIPDTSGDDVIFLLQDTNQTVTNKTIIDSSNDVRCSLMATSGSDVNISTNAPADAGYALVATGATTATWQAAGAVFSPIARLVVSGEQSLSGNDSANAATLTTPDLALGDYRINWCFTWDTSAVSTYTITTYIDTTATTIGEFSYLPTLLSDTRTQQSESIYYWKGVSGVHNIVIDHETSSGVSNGSIQRIFIEVTRL